MRLPYLLIVYLAALTWTLGEPIHPPHLKPSLEIPGDCQDSDAKDARSLYLLSYAYRIEDSDLSATYLRQARARFSDMEQRGTSVSCLVFFHTLQARLR